MYPPESQPLVLDVGRQEESSAARQVGVYKYDHDAEVAWLREEEAWLCEQHAAVRGLVTTTGDGYR